MLGTGARLGARAPERECSNTAIVVDRSECDTAVASLPIVEIGDAQIITRRLSDTAQISWVITRSDGTEGEGPVALIERRERGLVVRAQGTLRADLGRPRFRLMANNTILMIDSERCTNADDPSTCQRTAQLMLKSGNRFVREPIRHRETGRCLGTSEIPLARTVTHTLGNGWERTFALNASLEESGSGLLVHETVSVTDRDPRSPVVPPRPFREVSADRELAHGSTWTAESGALLQRTLIELASVEAPLATNATGESDER